MHAAVCFATVPDYSMMQPDDWVMKGNHQVDFSCLRRIFNCCDEGALEMGLQLAERDSSIELTAITVDSSHTAELFLKRLSASGYDHVCQVVCTDSTEVSFSPEQKAAVLSSVLQKLSVDVVLTGTCNEHGTTPALVAENLCWPFFSDVVDLSIQGDEVEVCSGTAVSLRRQKAPLPLTAAIGSSVDCALLRLPTLREKLAAEKRKIERIEVELDTPGALRPVRVFKRQNGRVVHMIDEDEPALQAEMLKQWLQENR